MQITITNRHGSIPDSMEAYAKEKAERLTKYFDRIEGIELIFDHTKSQQDVEIIVHVGQGNDIVAHASCEDLRTAIDQCLDRAHRQVTDHKSKLRDDKHHG
ncbi:MAG: ribosomal subunit interface protein [Phycisphaerae bacterium]|nr:ribosomal subunit interface protein [Phycisphaerae bacterium]|tara:strand:+ start:236 stop:538 length:303 start_codon:yes stop_codon:yes gene_type:complete